MKQLNGVLVDVLVEVLVDVLVEVLVDVLVEVLVDVLVEVVVVSTGPFKIKPSCIWSYLQHQLENKLHADCAPLFCKITYTTNPIEIIRRIFYTPISFYLFFHLIEICFA
jgi:hypothetical protein